MTDLKDGRQGQDCEQQKIVYLVQDPFAAVDHEQIDLSQVARVIWAKKIWIALATLLVTGAAIVYVMNATEWYRAQAVLILREGASGSRLSAQLSQFSGLASIAGLNLGTGNVQEPLGTLKSWGFSQRFVVGNQLVDVLPVPRSSEELERDPAKKITRRVDEFRRSILSVTEDKKTGLITISIEWKDPVVAADWANKIADQVNNELRDKALDESTRNIAYLREQLKTTDAVSLQQAIGSLLETEMQKVMLAQGTDEYAFRVIDRAQPPALRERPKRTLIVLIALLGGFFGSTMAALVASPLRKFYGDLRTRSASSVG